MGFFSRNAHLIPRYIVGLSATGTIVGTIVLLRDWDDVKFECDRRLDNKTVIVTGATSGIGKETARQLAERGGRIILACRDMEKCATVCQELIEATKNKNLFCKRLDLASMKSIKEFAEDVNQNEERLDILVNNAGVMSNKRSVTEDGFEKQIGVNYLGRFLLTHLLLDKMKTTDSWSRIINVVCIGYNNTRINFGDFNSESYFRTDWAHKMSSLANIIFTVDLAEKLKGSSVGVYSANPGLAETKIRREFGRNMSLSKKILQALSIVSFKLPSQACQTTIFCAITPELEGEQKHSGKLFHNCCEEDVKSEAMTHHTRERLWKTAEYWTGLVDYSHLVDPEVIAQSPQSLSTTITNEPLVASVVQTI